MEPETEIEEGCDFIRKLLQKVKHKEEIDLIINTLDHTSEAHVHISSMCANLSYLTKITN